MMNPLEKILRKVCENFCEGQKVCDYYSGEYEVLCTLLETIKQEILAAIPHEKHYDQCPGCNEIAGRWREQDKRRLKQ